MMPDNRDEIFRILARLIDEFTNDGRLPPGSSLEGYAIIAVPGGIPGLIRMSPAELPELSPEVIEGEGEVHVTAALPPGCDTLPTVTFQPLLVGISLGGETIPVNLPSRIDLAGCSWQVKNRVLDISCRKA
jgi:hypothetical protein